MIRRLHGYFCRGWHAITAQVVLWVVLASMFGVGLQAIRHEGAVREQQLCGVVINVHHNAQFRARTEHQNLQSTLDYLADPDSKHDAPALYRRVKANLSVVQARDTEARAAVRATEIPPVCLRYVRS